MYGHENWSIPINLGGAVCLCVALIGTSPALAEVARWYSPEQVDRGAAVFTQHCAECHGANAEAKPNWRDTTPEGKYPPPPLNGTAHAWHHPLDVLRRQIRFGGVPLGGTMPPFKDKLSSADIDAAIAFFQSKWTDEIYAAWKDRGGDSPALVQTAATAAEEGTTRYLRQRFPKLEIGAPEGTPVEGVVLVKAGGQYVYLTADGRHAFVGNLLDLETGANLTEISRATRVPAATSTGSPKLVGTIMSMFCCQTVGVIPCGYCRKLHREVPRLQSAGVTVTYVPFPRSGPTGPAYETMRQVWCSSDRQAAMNIAKGVAAGDLGSGDCTEADAVKAGYELGVELGVNGTPAIVLPDGRLQPGYLPAEGLLGTLGLTDRQTTSLKTR